MGILRGYVGTLGDYKGLYQYRKGYVGILGDNIGMRRDYLCMYRDRYPKERIMSGLKIDYIIDRYIKGLLPQYCRIYWTRKKD